jgi:hypothetical protein
VKQAEAAAYVGVDRKRIRTLHEQGRIKRNNVTGEYDKASLDAYIATRDPDRRAVGKRGNSAPDEPSQSIQPKPATRVGRPPSLSPAAGSGSGAAGLTYADLQRAEKAEKVRILQSKRKRMDGDLLPKEDVVNALFSVVKVVQQKIVAWEPKFLPHMSDTGRELVKSEIRLLLDGLATACTELPDKVHKDDEGAAS